MSILTVIEETYSTVLVLRTSIASEVNPCLTKEELSRHSTST
jgi:hypothetical protein